MRSLSLSAAALGRAARRVVTAMTRHPILSSFLVALGIRVVSAGLISWTPDVYEGNLVPDEGHFLIIARVASMGELVGFWPGYGHPSAQSAFRVGWRSRW